MLIISTNYSYSFSPNLLIKMNRKYIKKNQKKSLTQQQLCKLLIFLYTFIKKKIDYFLQFLSFNIQISRILLENSIIKMQSLQIQQPKKEQIAVKQKSFNHQTIFLVHGITCLIGWFVVLNALDYFQSIFKEYDVYALFLLFLLIGYLITVILFRRISKRYSIQRIIGIGLIICTISLISLLLIALLFQHVDALGFILSIIVCLVIGVSSNIVQLSYFSIINFVSEKVISRFTLGTALSGLCLTIIRMILTAIFGVQPHFFPILIYFLIACAVQIADLFLNNIFCRSQYFLQKVSPFINKNKQLRKVLNADTAQVEITQQKQTDYFKQLWKVTKKIQPYPLIIFLNYMITMMLFPDLTVKIKFGFSPVWSSLTFIFFFGLGDTVGKFMVQVKRSFNRASNIYLIAIRFLFLFFIPVMASGKVQDDPLIMNNIFPFVILLLFGFTGGFIISSSMILIFQKCDPLEKQMSGILGGISLQIGLIIGTILAIPLQLIIK